MTQISADDHNAFGEILAVASTTSDLETSSPPTTEQIPTARYDLQVLHLLRQIIRAVDKHSRQLLGQHQITGPQLIGLLTIEQYGTLTASAIAGHIHLSPSTMIGILDRLENKGLIRRERDLLDRRLVQVSLTEQGKALVKNAPSPLQDTLADALGKLPKAELQVIVESLERIVGLMQIQTVKSVPNQEAEPLDLVLGDIKTNTINKNSGRKDFFAV